MSPLVVLLVACGGSAKRSEPVPHDLDLDKPVVEAAPASSDAGTAESAAPAAPKVDCAGLVRGGAKKHDTGDLGGALEAYKSGLPACERGFGLLTEMGYTLAAQGKLDEAAVAYIAELRGNPVPTTFGNLLEILPRLSIERRKEVAALGTKEAPIHVPDIGIEYSWVARFGCVDGRGKSKGQAVVNVGGKKLDRVTYVCPDKSEHTTYFDFSSDPATQAFENELRPTK